MFIKWGKLYNDIFRNISLKCIPDFNFTILDLFLKKERKCLLNVKVDSFSSFHIHPIAGFG